MSSDYIYVTGIAMDVRSFETTLEELLLYDWKTFIGATAQFEFLEAVEMIFTTESQCSRMIQDNQDFIADVVATRRRYGLTKCTYNYSVQGVGVRESR